MRENSCLITSVGPSLAGEQHILSSVLAVGNAQSRAGASSTRCSALPESNGVWSSKGRPASPSLPSGRQWSRRDSWSVQKPLHVPLEDAIHRGNWLEAKGLVDKLLSVGSLQDISSLDKLIKGVLAALQMKNSHSHAELPQCMQNLACCDTAYVLQAFVWNANSRQDGDCSNPVQRHINPWGIQLIKQ